MYHHQHQHHHHQPPAPSNTTKPAYNVAPAGYPLRTLEQLRESSPSREHGLSEEQEQWMLRTATNLIIGAGQQLHM